MERNKNLTGLSQKLRREQTKEEALLWYRFLRRYPLRFRRQYVVGNYIVDFYCHGARLAVELDGSGHYEPAGQTHDAVRDTYLLEQGILVLRYSNLDVTQRFSGVCEEIHRTAQARAPIPSPGERVPRRGG